MATKNVVCDTDVMIDYLDVSKTRHLATKEILEKVIALDGVVLSAITKMELMIGAINKVDMANTNKKLARFGSVLIDHDITLKAISLLQSHSLSHDLSIADSIIAASAIITDLELFTYNTKDFKFISELRLFKP